MNAKLFIIAGSDALNDHLEENLESLGMSGPNQSDLLIIDEDKALGVEAAKKIRAHLSLRPLVSDKRVVIVKEAHRLTADAQNSLLKTIEELNDNHYIYMFGSSDNTILPTILSRVEVIRSFYKQNEVDSALGDNFFQSDQKNRFSLIEKTEDKDLLFASLMAAARQLISQGKLPVALAEKILEAEKRKKSNVNLRGILEHLSLILPKI